MARFLRAALQLSAIVIAFPALADEGASGLYAPGNFGFGAGVTPDTGFYINTGIAHYEGDIRIYIDGGRIIADAEVQPYSLAVTALWVPKTKILGGNLGLSVSSPEKHAWAHGVVRGLINADKTVQGWGYGDTTARAQLGWTSGDWSNTLYLTTWFPTGRYQRGFNPNTGKNIYGVNLGWGVTYTEPRTQLEFDSAVAITFSARNPATDYKNGDDFIWDWAVGRKFANGLKLGAGGYVYQQLTGDSGSGARLGPFKGSVVGIGPHVVYNTVLMHRPMILNFRHYQEFDAKNRFEGNLTTFSTTVKF